jgi:hypothetical protein
MSSWYLPADIQAWSRRLLAPRSATLLLLLAALAMTELRFDWIESLVGGYLVKTNVGRPESGAGWEQGRQSHQARQTLESFMNQRRSAQAEASRAGSMGQLIASIGAANTTMVSSEHFVELYQKLPPILSHELISPFVVLALTSAGKWQRTYFERQDQQLLIFLLDGDNQVLQRIAVNAALLNLIQRGEVAITGSLDQLSDFARHIFPAERFFNMLNAMPVAQRRAIIPDPSELLRISGRIVRVGISNNTDGDNVDLGFEIQAADGLKVILVQSRADEARRLQRALEGGSAFIWPPPRVENEGIPQREH